MGWVLAFRSALFLLTMVYLDISDGMRCRVCHDAMFLEDCTRSIECALGRECFTDQIVTGQLEIVYSAGCRPKEVCVGAATSGPSIGKKNNYVNDLIACSRCCNSNIITAGHECNTRLCGFAAATRMVTTSTTLSTTTSTIITTQPQSPTTAPQAGGLRCRRCVDAFSLDNCMITVECYPHEECYMDDVVDIHTLAITYNGGCRRRDVCKTASVGRRTLGRSLSGPSSLVACSSCCDDSNECNTRLCGIKLLNG